MTRDKIFRFKLLPFLIFLLSAATALGGPATLRISTDMQTIGIGETFHISIEATNCPGSMDISQIPPGCKIVYQSTSSSMGTLTQGGKTIQTNKTTLVLTCKGETPGKYSFGPVSIGGVKSNTISYQISSQSSTPNSSGNANNQSGNQASPQNFDPNGGPMFIGKGNEEMFLKAIVNKTTAYEQEAIEYTVKLYTTYGDIKFLGATAAPKFDGFVVEESSDISKSFTFETFNGKTYKTAIIARYIIFPQKAGDLKVSGNTYTVSTDARQYYHDPYFQTLTVKYPVQLNVTPNDISISVKPLPTPIPADFIGGVGNFRISSSLPSKNLSTNTPASLIYTIQGTGNIKYIKIPELQTYFPPSIEIYSPDITVDSNVAGGNVTGTAKFDYSLMPQETGRFTIPSLSLSYFDPESGTYKKLQTESYNIEVGMGKASDKSQQAMKFNPELLPVGKLAEKDETPYVYSFIYWLWYIIPVLIFILALVSYRKYLKDHEDLTLLRSKQANKMAMKRLAKAYQCFKAHKEEQFYDEMLAALWGYIGDKLKMPTSELTRSNVGEEFSKHGISEATFMPIINLIDECEYAKYTPVSRDANMRQLYTDAIESLAKVESEYKMQKGKSDNNDKEIDDDTQLLSETTKDN